MVIQYKEWFTPWRQDSWFNDAETSVLVSYLEDSLPPREVVETITAPAPDGKIERVWGILLIMRPTAPKFTMLLST